MTFRDAVLPITAEFKCNLVCKAYKLTKQVLSSAATFETRSNVAVRSH